MPKPDAPQCTLPKPEAWKGERKSDLGRWPASHLGRVFPVLMKQEELAAVDGAVYQGTDVDPTHAGRMCLVVSYKSEHHSRQDLEAMAWILHRPATTILQSTGRQEV